MCVKNMYAYKMGIVNAPQSDRGLAL